MTDQHYKDLMPTSEVNLLISGLQALHRERTKAWSIACGIAAQHGRDAPKQDAFGINEVTDALRRWGAAPEKY